MTKMALISVLGFFLVIMLVSIESHGSVLTLDKNGVYQRLTVEVTEAVPRQLCQRALNNLQVG